MSERVKICYCGSAARLRVDDNERYWFVKCGNCGRASIHSRTTAEAIEAWNIGGEWPAQDDAHA